MRDEIGMVISLKSIVNKEGYNAKARQLAKEVYKNIHAHVPTAPSQRTRWVKLIFFRLLDLSTAVKMHQIISVEVDIVAVNACSFTQTMSLTSVIIIIIDIIYYDNNHHYYYWYYYYYYYSSYSSQLPLRRTPLGPAVSVHLREMSVL